MDKKIAEILKKQPSRCVDFCRNRGNVNCACENCDREYRNFKPRADDIVKSELERLTHETAHK